MKWKVVARPQAQVELCEAADWYDSKSPGPGEEFIQAVFDVFDALTINPLLHPRRHATRNIRWRFTKRFPYRVIYEVIDGERQVVVAAILHVARHQSVWQRRFSPN
ncbi:MAG TPA: type II toxin-antitoxin system RelE/ParE family toxin [Pyrinomonadaceae bacterium]